MAAETKLVTGSDAASTKATNRQVVESAYDAFDRGDLDAFTSLMDDRFISTQSDAVPWRGSHAGPEGVRSMLGMVGERASARYVPEELIDGGDRIVVIGRAELTPVADGRPRVVREVHVWGVSSGRLTSLDVFLNAPGELLAALGA
jgi:ketosteroid isomerase-like protein